MSGTEHFEVPTTFLLAPISDRIYTKYCRVLEWYISSMFDNSSMDSFKENLEETMFFSPQKQGAPVSFPTIQFWQFRSCMANPRWIVASPPKSQSMKVLKYHPQRFTQIVWFSNHLNDGVAPYFPIAYRFQ